MIERLNCEAGKVCQVVRMCDKPRGACESKTLGFTCTVTDAVMLEDVVLWKYEGQPKRCDECGHGFFLLPDRNMKMLPGGVNDFDVCDPISKREPLKAHTTPKRSIPNAR